MAKALFLLSMVGSLFAKGILIPFYHYPLPNDTEVSQLVQYKKSYPDIDFVVIINPNNGDFDFSKPNFAKMIQRLHDANITTIGYIYTKYGKRALSKVKESVEKWNRFYKKFGIEGIFIDEVNSSLEMKKYYETIAQHIKKNFPIVVLNPGVDAAHLMDISDIVVLHEDFRMQDCPKRREKSALLLHSIQDFERYKKCFDKFDYIYVTEKKLPNPWSGLSIYIKELLYYLQSSHSITFK